MALEKEEDKQAKQLDDVKSMVEKILKRFEEEVRNCKLTIIIITSLNSRYETVPIIIHLTLKHMY